MTSAHGLRKLGSVGLLLPNLEARLVLDTDGLADAKEGESGELWIRGPSVMKVGSKKTLCYDDIHNTFS
jgi:acyl-CoA synthetase (AMP-forming)/AMP-acid ligase II